MFILYLSKWYFINCCSVAIFYCKLQIINAVMDVHVKVASAFFITFVHVWQICSPSYTVTQNHRMVEVGRDLWCNPPAQVEPPTASCPGPWQTGFECLQYGRLHGLSGKPVLVLSHSHNKTVFPYV